MRTTSLRFGRLLTGLACVAYVALGFAILRDERLREVYLAPATIVSLAGLVAGGLLWRGIVRQSHPAQITAGGVLAFASVAAWLGLGAAGYPGWPDDYLLFAAATGMLGLCLLAVGMSRTGPDRAGAV